MLLVGGRKGIWPVKTEWWCGHLSGARCKCLHMVQLMPLSHPFISSFIEIKNGLPFWCQLTQVVLEIRPLN